MSTLDPEAYLTDGAEAEADGLHDDLSVKEQLAEQAAARAEAGDPKCPKAKPGKHYADDPRCYSCGHIFDFTRSRSDVLCPCCTK